MQAKAEATTPPSAAARRAPSHPLYLNEGLSPKKTALIIVTVIGCIAILWPKVFYPMMFGSAVTKPSNNAKEQRGPGGIRQERPSHLHPESIYQAMRERGRAIPASATVPIVERKGSPGNPPPRIVDGRPGPIPGMRPPMGAGSLHQPQTKGSSMGFIMPLYTIGIIIFFGYTIMKIVFKKPIPNAPYGPAPADPNFRKEVFGQENGRHVEELNGSKLGTNLPHSPDPRNGNELYNASLSAATAASNLSTSLKQHQLQHKHQQQQQHSSAKPAIFNQETEQLMEIEKLRKKLEDTEKAMAKLIAEMNSDQFEAKKSNENSTLNKADTGISNGHTSTEHEAAHISHEDDQHKGSAEEGRDALQRKRREGNIDRSVAVLGMEISASCEGGQKWTGRPPTPVFYSHNEHEPEVSEPSIFPIAYPSKPEDDMPEPQSIYLEGSLAHDSQILVSDSETRTEEVYDEELNGSPEEPAVVLSSKMTLSLINLNGPSTENGKHEIESPLADDIEIIGHEEQLDN